jgi:hypothetical protein
VILNYCKGFVAYNIQTGNNKVKLRTEYESVESILQNAKELQHSHFYFVVSCLKIIGHGNPDNNLESHCTFILKKKYGPTLFKYYNKKVKKVLYETAEIIKPTFSLHRFFSRTELIELFLLFYIIFVKN